jgi:hypothetical protein
MSRALVGPIQVPESTSVPTSRDDLPGDVSADGFAIRKFDARFIGTIEPVVGLAHHRRQS